MAQKVNPISVRLNFNRSSDSGWFSDYYFGKLLYQDFNLRDYFGSIRPPRRNKFGLRLGRCIIHHFTKRTFIHLYLLDRNYCESRTRALGLLSRVNVRDGLKLNIENGGYPATEIELLGVSGWMTSEEHFLRRENQNHEGVKHSSYAFRSAPDEEKESSSRRREVILPPLLLAAVRRAPLNHLVMQYLFYLNNESTRFDTRVYNVAQGVGTSSPTRERAQQIRLGKRRGLRELWSVLDFGAPFLSRDALQKRWKAQSSYWTKIETLSSSRTNTFTSIEPVKITCVYKSASLIAKEISYELERKKSFQRICGLIFERIENCNCNKYAKGIRIRCSGRFKGAEIAKTEYIKSGETSLHVFSDQIDYAEAGASTPYGTLGVKVWVSYYLLTYPPFQENPSSVI
uniref:Small ribosomal subunit protein uS3m n=1 Tax=Isoetes engelmannii TaxID=37427 RepID=C6FG16_ISOEN|nr:ribosomal protein S3 [Isoetes engelmannii]ACI95881.1 ribosomal protein S3 [Isoetes engelmannii]